MAWSSLFLINIVQGIFLIFLIGRAGSKNLIASRLIITLLLLIVFTNVIYVTIRTDFRYYAPQLFGLQFGLVLLFGPLLYFYSRSVIDSSFHWKTKYWLHFIPYLVQLSFNFRWLLRNNYDWNWYINSFLAGEVTVRNLEKVTYIIQDCQLLVYLALIFNLMRQAENSNKDAQYLTPLSTRLKWLRELCLCFFLFLLTLVALYIFVVVKGKYNPVTNYIYTLVTSGIIYFIAYKLVLNPGLISPGFARKYHAYRQLADDDGEKYLQKLKSLMIESRIFTNPDLKLALLARQMGLPAHQVSKLINEKFGKSYNDFVNEYRVQEFISRINNADFKAFSIYGIALDVGFNSKSSFNTAFKKITGKNPSDFKNLTPQNV